jgi:hypothetical protein
MTSPMPLRKLLLLLLLLLLLPLQELDSKAAELAVCLGKSNFYGALFTVKQMVDQGKADGELHALSLLSPLCHIQPCALDGLRACSFCSCCACCARWAVPWARPALQSRRREARLWPSPGAALPRSAFPGKETLPSLAQGPPEGASVH